ncbi:UDP-N-acetylmuramoylalanyl-D-glutamyl-2,6-diaminopimelate--D-alanyl-D-alanine ligase [Rhizobium sp. FKL33]|uniref:UDP-N-acetylmuramoylalanyl-D-glutamyl-2, 6-diaminopimelate--D-alanyl-D-alanine ligase n=1 Tax=Rhizobium sp. FKL33 TaxID=2562307 RepID=UPI0010C0D57F|nr:UDP-N-acetylmuramoylalanyl-D-glutamyl-2,6-diaminopimelate--D-alanyl-D-alanine ligase [Rhizobium sp. FKL33]
MAYLWTSEDLIAATHGRPRGTLPAGITGISIDSRAIQPGEAFFAIKGDRVDGHDYANIAAAHGAALLVVSEGKLPALGAVNAPMLVVPDVLEAMEKLGRAARDRSNARIIAVTGSVGKTTTKDMLRQVLGAAGKVHYSPASFNNHWGVPLTLARMPADADYGVFEIGMNHPNEIRPLVKMVRPHVAIITTIAAAHLGNFSGLDEIARAKAEIFEGVAENGAALINRDIEQFELLDQLAAEAHVAHTYSFGAHAKADFRLIDYQQEDQHGVFWAIVAGRTIEVAIQAPGRHIAENALAVLAASYLAGADLDTVVSAFAGVGAGKGRGARSRLTTPGGAFTLIDESYNANPASMRAAIALLGAAKPDAGGRRIAVLGDMLEMGDYSPQVHADLAQPIGAEPIDAVWLAGPDMAYLRDALGDSRSVLYWPTVDEMKAYVVDNVRPGDVVMIKSSNGSGCGRIVAALMEQYPASTSA